MPGTAKTWVSEHLAAAISGDSTLLVQGTAGTTEESLRYGWNYARLLAEGPSEAALVPSPVYRAMRTGRLVRIEELTRMPCEVQDALVTILSEKVLPVPELDAEVAAVQGSTSSPPPTTATAGSTSCRAPCAGASTPSCCRCRPRPTRRWPSSPSGSPSWAPRWPCRTVPAAADEIRRVVTIFRELREGVTADGRTSLKTPTGTLSTAEAISVVTNGLALAAHFGDGTLRPATSPGASSAPSCATRCTTRSPGGSTSRGWCAIARAGMTSTTPVASSPEHGRPAGRTAPDDCTCSGSATTGPVSARSVRRALDGIRPDVC